MSNMRRTPPMPQMAWDESSIVAKAEQFVKDEMQGQDASHDFAHVERVRRLALELAEEEGVEAKLVVELGALLHDVRDYKYSGDDRAGPACAREFLQARQCPEDIVERVIAVIAGIGFKHTLGNEPVAMTPELACVQDADRLDAIGAIGIARCFTFGGAKGRPMYEEGVEARTAISAEEYADKRQGTTVNHFYEKLLHLADRMNTEAGRRRARGRHAFMEAFLNQLQAEIAGQL
ncbi:HD/PDEase domain-containing protein [Plasmodiophora brassicae]|uniref:HD/PDEase domain-containing protein n=1 Tax=Plasmodiophora brassicae TaxID=37360 RepID=A0A0G4IPH0_PLABS|nr:hypothetical protein PBRA_000562 [Plasmodiophora brassicae]SPQ97528.1 unnamed protein product [Plasmodiophora brassicae]